MPSMSFKNATPSLASYQPLPQDAMDVQFLSSASKEHTSSHAHSHRHSSQEQCGSENGYGSHSACHFERRRRALRILAFSACAMLLLALAGFVYSCGAEGVMGFVAEGALGRRQTNSSSGSQDGVFVKNKLYLIVVIVGLFVCLILGVMLAAWCCKGSFENPLCCPCYLCACCGGLACLECISCGLCAEGVDDIGFN